MEDNKLHSVVELMLARMESHPHEFKYGAGRWREVLDRIQSSGSSAEVDALSKKLRVIRLDELHEEVLDELCNGDERRRKAAEEEAAQRLETLEAYKAIQQHNLQNKKMKAEALAGSQGRGLLGGFVKWRSKA